jgi:thiamine pyrophosphokinase
MKLSKELGDISEWIIVGPMGPFVPAKYSTLPALAVDGGANFTQSMRAWIGDSDSCHTAPASAVVFQLPREKDYSDFSCALRLFDRQLKYTFHLWVFSGVRKYHELFVWGEILSFIEQHPE